MNSIGCFVAFESINAGLPIADQVGIVRCAIIAASVIRLEVGNLDFGFMTRHVEIAAGQRRHPLRGLTVVSV
jgi:hypothetical protein